MQIWVKYKNQNSGLTCLFSTLNAFQNGMTWPNSTNNYRGDTFQVHDLIGGQAEAVQPQPEVLWKILELKSNIKAHWKNAKKIFPANTDKCMGTADKLICFHPWSHGFKSHGSQSYKVRRQVILILSPFCLRAWYARLLDLR